MKLRRILPLLATLAIPPSACQGVGQMTVADGRLAAARAIHSCTKIAQGNKTELDGCLCIVCNKDLITGNARGQSSRCARMRLKEL